MPFSFNHALDLIRKARDLDRLGHAYLVSGPKAADLEAFACGMLNIASEQDEPNLQTWREHGAWVIRPESKSRRITVEQVREMEHEIHMTSGPQGHKFGVIVDAERLSVQAQNAFLRTLEEPPPRTLFLLLSHHPQQLLTTILSRVIEMNLLPPPGARVFTEQEHSLLTLLSQISNRHHGTISGALALKAGFQDLLEDLKNEIKKEQEGEFKREQDHYQKTTDGSWLKQREEQIEAIIASRYQEQRDSLMDLLLAWVGDVARHQAGASHLDLPTFADSTAALSERWPEQQLAKRLGALRRLDQLLHTNVNEGLALEVCLIDAFA